MKRLEDTVLRDNQQKALTELGRRLRTEFGIESVVLYGSIARGEADEVKLC